MATFRAYLDSSVIGGVYDHEFALDTRRLMALVEAGRVTAVVSEMVVDEIDRAPRQVKEVLDALLKGGAEMLRSDPEVRLLQEAYLEGGVIGPKWADDAMHVALATLSGVDALATWNFKHMIAPDRSRGFGEVNVRMGYPIVSLLSPTSINHVLETSDED